MIKRRDLRIMACNLCTENTGTLICGHGDLGLSLFPHIVMFHPELVGIDRPNAVKAALAERAYEARN